MSFVRGLHCRECGQDSPQEPLHVCETCFGPLEIVYDYDAITREKIAARDKNLWRYRELLPIDGEPRLGCTRVYPAGKSPSIGSSIGSKGALHQR